MAEENVMKRNTEATNSQAAAITSGFVQDLIAAVASVVAPVIQYLLLMFLFLLCSSLLYLVK